MVVSHQYAVLSTRFNTCLPCFIVESNLHVTSRLSMFNVYLYRNELDRNLFVYEVGPNNDKCNTSLKFLVKE